jgi:DnaJ-class molecular chaperone
MTKMDHYKVLGIDKTATHAQITSAFRRKVLEYHPDRNHSPDAKEMFIRVNQAFEVLGNPERRSAYDYLHSQPQSQPQHSYDTDPHEYTRRQWGVLGLGRGWAPLAVFVVIIGFVYIITEILKALGWR